MNTGPRVKPEDEVKMVLGIFGSIFSVASAAQVIQGIVDCYTSEKSVIAFGADNPLLCTAELPILAGFSLISGMAGIYSLSKSERAREVAAQCLNNAKGIYDMLPSFRKNNQTAQSHQLESVEPQQVLRRSERLKNKYK